MVGSRRKSSLPQQNIQSRTRTRAYSLYEASKQAENIDENLTYTPNYSNHQNINSDSENYVVMVDEEDQTNISQISTGYICPETPLDLSIKSDKTLNRIAISNIDSSLYCYFNCKYGRKLDRPILQCSLCMVWHHVDCTDGTVYQTVWTCNKCRSLPDVVTTLSQQISDMQLALSNLLDKQNEFYLNTCEMSMKNAKLTQENKALQKQLYEYRLKSYNELSSCDSSVSDVTSDEISSESDIETSPIVKRKVKKNRRRSKKSNLQAKVQLSFEDNTQVQSTPSIYDSKDVKNKPKARIIGDSVIRDAGSRLSTIVKDFDTCVLSTSGYTIDDAAANIGSLVNGHTDKDIVILQVGTNDLQNCNQFQLADKYSVLINITKQTAPDSQIVVTAIPNRITAKSNEVNKKIDIFNQTLRIMCDKDSKCLFAACSPESSAKFYRRDGYHFNSAGITHFSIALADFINTNFRSLNVFQKV